MKRVDLSKSDKVTLFSSLAIEISSKCNRTCYFCPNGYNDRPDVQMPNELVVKLLLELQALKYRGRLEWYIYNEPTRDKRLPEFIAQARTLLPKACQMINTNGDYFKSAADIQRLFDAGLNQMQINIYSAKDGCGDLVKIGLGATAAQLREALIQSWVDKLNIPQDVSLYQNIGPKRRAIKVVAKYGIRMDVSNSEVSGPNHFSNRSGNIPAFRNGLTKSIAKMCTKPFRFLNVNYNGEALLCCNDYHGAIRIGNIKDHTLETLWNSPVLNKYRIKLQHKNRECTLCDVCDFNGGPYPHMVDTITMGTPALDDHILKEKF